mgnify:CR=1 FL=1
MKRKISILLCVMILCTAIICTYTYSTKDQKELKTVKSDQELLDLYESNNNQSLTLLEKVLTLPFSIIMPYNRYYSWDDGIYKNQLDGIDYEITTSTEDLATAEEKDYSETNIQVEGVDEADIIKTDGDYIYSISEDKVIITNVKDPEDIQIESTIQETPSIPNELLLYKDKLIVISYGYSTNGTYYTYYSGTQNTNVYIYDVKDKKNPKLKKSFQLNESYSTSRCINGKLYIFSSGYLRMENNTVEREYIEDNITKEIPLNNIKYLKNNHNNIQTLIAEVDIENLDKEIELSSYLIDMTNAYVSKENIYLIKEEYEYNYDTPKIKDMFGIMGIFGLEKTSYYEITGGAKTTVYKFKITKEKGVEYKTRKKLEGNIVNQYSLDEKDGNLRIALYNNDGTHISILDEKLKILGETDNVAKGEMMYASRFMDDKAYLVTYKNTDPLFVVDLSNPKSPKILGELKIPGYSTYLHPYDENHLIGIGMETKEVINRDYNGNVTGTWTEVVGMKMSLFDVTDMNNPKQIDTTVIGDRRTVSAILTNPKALLFSKEKELLAIPVNNYKEDFTSNQSTNYIDEITSYTNSSGNYVSEGYFVYKVNLDGFQLKGTLTHEKTTTKIRYYESKLLRGLYIEDNLYTISEDYIKVNELETLNQIASLNLKGEN